MAAAQDDEDRPHSREHQARKIPGGELYGRSFAAPHPADGTASTETPGAFGGGGGGGGGVSGAAGAPMGQQQQQQGRLSTAAKTLIVVQHAATDHDALGHSHHAREARQRLEAGHGDATRLEREQSFIRERRKTQINERLCCASVRPSVRPSVR